MSLSTLRCVGCELREHIPSQSVAYLASCLCVCSMLTVLCVCLDTQRVTEEECRSLLASKWHEDEGFGRTCGGGGDGFGRTSGCSDHVDGFGRSSAYDDGFGRTAAGSTARDGFGRTGGFWGGSADSFGRTVGVSGDGFGRTGGCGGGDSFGRTSGSGGGEDGFGRSGGGDGFGGLHGAGDDGGGGDGFGESSASGGIELGRTGGRSGGDGGFGRLQASGSTEEDSNISAAPAPKAVLTGNFVKSIAFGGLDCLEEVDEDLISASDSGSPVRSPAVSRLGSFASLSGSHRGSFSGSFSDKHAPGEKIAVYSKEANKCGAEEESEGMIRALEHVRKDPDAEGKESNGAGCFYSCKGEA